ncbi:D-alanyl-D-alanine carboxypeptidase family protein [Sedimentibacter sp. MB31-C6]|uniref:D-alanyl-D-alanine carboxypeptidase family protein n=1 Tax=Sedimentibacter sp. MB31-C6 TaxID=3109366 RepID=UPI002DDCB567|nr:D-alanyl-D-alanine carboxypeptidase family protein [Sedimentibacter sp. MB36-C1]WSI04406.1 D-alanyl-D-alanine carboxypeptidase family protein [Sedimentibacter sp. MB36-C1]
MVKKILVYSLIFSIIILNINLVQAQTKPSLLSESAILIDSNSGTILLEKNPNKKMHPASLTKIMTAIIAIESGDLSDVIKVDDDTPYEIYGSHIALEPGEILTLKDLLYALMLPSANDAAAVIAKHYGGSIEEFVEQMNEKAKDLGAHNTNFVNPHGLHDENHYSTASDLALITKYAMKNETFRKIVGTVKYEIKPTNKKSEVRYLATLNKLIHNTSTSQIIVDGTYINTNYDGVTGVKTGYTPEAGNCLVASAEKNGTELIAVTMKGVSLEMYQDAHNMFNFGFNEYQSITIVKENTFIQNLQIKNGDSKEISLITESDFTTLTKKKSENDIVSKIIVDEITLPLEKNSIVGKIEYSLDGKLLGSVNLITPTEVKSTLINSDESIIVTIIKFIANLGLFILIIVLALKIYNGIRIKANRKRRRKKYRADL